MAQIVKDFYPGGSVGEDREGFKAVRVFHVSDLPETPEKTIAQALIEPGIPLIGEPHPIFPIQALSKEATATDAKKAEVRVTYGTPRADQLGPGGGTNLNSSEVRVSVNTTLVQIETNKDSNGNLIKIDYEGEYRDEDGVLQNRQLPEQTGTVQIQVPVTALRFTRKENLIPFFAIKFIPGTTNADVFQGDVIGAWLCSGISAETEDNGDTYVVGYEFLRAPGNEIVPTWDVDVAYVVSETGEVPPGVERGNGLKRIQVYRREDFSTLNLPEL